MIAMIMRNKSEQLCALETGFSFVRSNYHYGWESAVDSKPKYSFFAELKNYIKRSVVLFIAFLNGRQVSKQALGNRKNRS